VSVQGDHRGRVVNRLDHVVVVGASAAGLTAVEALRREGFDGRLTLVGDERQLPYDRPPLSKQVLAGSWEPERVSLRDPHSYPDLRVELILGRAASGLDLAGHKLHLVHREPLPFDGLIVSTGVRPRKLPAGHELAGVHLFRTLGDALNLRAKLLGAPRIVIVGAGFLGAEVAAVAREAGAAVTMVDPLPTPMYRQFGARIGTLVADLHTEHGVDVRTGVGVERLVGAEGRVCGVALTDGALLDADLVLVAIGAAPATEWLAGSGLRLGDGVECDAYCQAAPGVYAAGDVASWYNRRFGTRMRLEHRTNASEQAVAAALNLLGANEPYTPVPYFWTDQYDTKIQALGVFPKGSDQTVVSGSLADRRFVVLYGHSGRVVGALGWNCPRELRAHRRHVVDGTPWQQIRQPSLTAG
jgi:3-phenylpropionate/trans-cinnamate dioxygenase ferredoxin reductase component